MPHLPLIQTLGGVSAYFGEIGHLFGLKTIVALLAIVITLICRPSGLFGRQKELEERV